MKVGVPKSIPKTDRLRHGRQEGARLTGLGGDGAAFVVRTRRFMPLRQHSRTPRQLSTFGARRQEGAGLVGAGADGATALHASPRQQVQHLQLAQPLVLLGVITRCNCELVTSHSGTGAAVLALCRHPTQQFTESYVAWLAA